MNTFDSAPTYRFARFESIAATPGTIKASPGHRHSRAAVPDDIKSAVYSHIQAIRSLGRTKTNTAEIADALDLDRKLVEAAVHSLREAGVRRIASRHARYGRRADGSLVDYGGHRCADR